MRAALVLACFAVAYFGGLGRFSLVDYDEACYAEVAHEMYQSGDLLVPVLDGQPFFEKPPLLYWGQVLGYRIFGLDEFGARAMNAVAALLTLLAVFAFARGPFGKRVALRAVLLLGAGLAFVGVTRMALTDMWLTLWFVLSLGFAHRGLEPEGRLRHFLLAGAASGLAMLTKGAVGLLLPGGAILIYAVATGRWRALLRPSRLLPTLTVALAVGMSWYLLLGITQPDGFGFLRELFLKHHVERFLEPLHRHQQGPFFYYLVVLSVGFLPFTFLLVPALWRGTWPRDGAGRRLLLLLGIFALLTVVFFSIAATKLPHYMTPVYPFLALCVAAALEPVALSEQMPPRRWRVAGLLSVLGVFAASAGCALIPYACSRLPGIKDQSTLAEAPGIAHPFDPGPAPYVMAAALLATGGVCLAKRWHRRPDRLVLPFVLGGLVAEAVLVVSLLPRVDAHFLLPLRRVALQAAALAPHEDRVALVGFRYRPSTIFYGGRLTRYVSIERPEDIETLFAGPGLQDAITVEPFVSRLREHGDVEVVAQDTGYVLVRCRPSREIR
jgi:4-amino-4-deoxy-L-arabinose transferase-like glycosyltransferase